MPEPGLPEAFRDLEPWLAWCLATEKERSDKRQVSSLAELQAFYDSVLTRMEDIFAYVEQFPLDDLPAEAHRLFLLTLSLAEVAPAIEQFGQPQVIDGYDIQRVTAVRRGIS